MWGGVLLRRHDAYIFVPTFLSHFSQTFDLLYSLRTSGTKLKILLVRKVWNSPRDKSTRDVEINSQAVLWDLLLIAPGRWSSEGLARSSCCSQVNCRTRRTCDAAYRLALLKWEDGDDWSSFFSWLNSFFVSERLINSNQSSAWNRLLAWLLWPNPHSNHGSHCKVSSLPIYQFSQLEEYLWATDRQSGAPGFNSQSGRKERSFFFLATGAQFAHGQVHGCLLAASDKFLWFESLFNFIEVAKRLLLCNYERGMKSGTGLIQTRWALNPKLMIIYTQHHERG